MANEPSAATGFVREVYVPYELREGDVIQYPAKLRPEHHFYRSRVVVKSVDKDGTV